MRSVLLLWFSAVTLVVAQTPFGSVTGVATDPASAAVPNVTVTVTNVQTGVARTVATNEAGVYAVPNLLPGNYVLTAEAKGFKKLETGEFPLAAFRTVRQDLRFELAGAATEVTVVEAASPVIQTESPSIATSLSGKQILDLPTNLRSVDNRPNSAGDSGVIFTLMPLTIPGIVQVGGGAKWLTPGGTATGTRLKVDGIDTNFGNFGSPDPVSQPSMESIQEFTANILTNRAEFGGLGTVTTVTRAGTNDLHGSVFWYMRNSALDARNTFAVAKPFQNVHSFGGNVGGAIRKDKTFFLGTFDGTKGSRAYLFTANVPTLRQREGDFTGVTLNNPLPGQTPFQNNRILPQFISPQARRMQELLFPLPNFGPPELTAGNYRAAFNGPEMHNIYEIRLDHNFTGGHQAFARYQHKKSDYDIPGARTQLPPSSVGTSQNIRRMNFWTLGAVSTLRPNIYNEARAGLVILASWSDADVRGDRLLPQIGIPQLPGRDGVRGVPNLQVAGLTAVSQSLLNPVNDGHWQLSDNVSWVSGRHTMKFGGEVVRWFVNTYLPVVTGLYGTYSFTNRFTGQPYADFLMGLPTSVTRQDPFPTVRHRFTDYAFFAQDDFKVTNRLTLSYGLRYEYNGPPSAKNGNLYSFDPASGSVVVPEESSRRLFSPFFPANIPVITADRIGAEKSLRNPDRNNWAPRFGFSYQLGAKSVLRGGYGIYYSHLSANITNFLSRGPYAISTTANNNIVNGQPLFTLANPFAAPGAVGTQNINGVSPRLLNSYTQQYSLTFERELVANLGLRVSYIGSTGHQLLYLRNINQPLPSATPFAQARRPYPTFNNISYGDNGANLWYSGLQTQVTRRFSNGLFFTSGWTWAKELSEIDDTGDFELNTAIENAYDRRRDRADVYSIPRHQWMNQALWELPLGKGHIRGGWQLNALVNLSTGNFLNPVFTGPDPSNTNFFGGRPDVVRPRDDQNTADAWFDRGAYAAPPVNAGRFGTAGRNTVQGPGYVVFNFGVNKSLTFERIGRVQIGASFVNLLNHVNYGEPNMTVNVAQGGRITSTHIFPTAGSPRTGMLSLRWAF